MHVYSVIQAQCAHPVGFFRKELTKLLLLSIHAINYVLGLILPLHDLLSRFSCSDLFQKLWCTKYGLLLFAFTFLLSFVNILEIG